VDAIKDQVFRGQRYEGRDAGTATIFQGDLRIATNVVREDGSRAVGTRLSAEVCSAVLDRGEVWAARAFVVNDWYITAYEPIRDPLDRIVGVLYVGLLQEPYTRRQSFIVSIFLLLVGLSTAASVLMLSIVTNVVLKPIQSVLKLAGKVRAGDLSARLGIRPPGEMGKLCEAIDSMAEAVANREQQLAHLTRQQIGQSEKLAAIGRLAAGIAHEINNPLTGVLTFAHMLRQKANMDPQDLEDLDVILRETTRVREIVRGLLDFARESPSTRQPLDLNEVVERTMTLIRSQKGFHKVQLAEDLDGELPPVVGDRNQLQQVLLNLCLNACEAMQGGGVLSVRTRSEGGRVALEVSDTGCGIKPEHLAKIFDPFFTTKPVGKGTGLGLSVSYGIVEQHGGTLEVASEEGRGTSFTVRLPTVERGVS
jgi:two-component system NtrC family sensor kinase